MSRWRASGLHLLISLAVALGAFLLLFLVWYPHPLFEASGGDRLVVLLITIDLVIGPLLTLIVYRAGKRGMRFDLLFIGTCQALALLYGLYVIAGARPIFVVFAVDRFVLVPDNRIDSRDLAEAPSDSLRRRSWTGPAWVGSKLPEDTNLRIDLAFSGIAGKDVECFPRYYVPYDAVGADVIKRSKPLSTLAGANEDERKRAEAFVASRADSAKLGFLPLVGRGRELSVIVDRDDGRVVTVLAVSPW